MLERGINYIFIFFFPLSYFHNKQQRQKARKVYENQPPSINDIASGAVSVPPTSTTPSTNINLTPCTTPNSATSSNSATPNPHVSSSNNSNARAQQFNYDCKKCFQSFHRYYELIKHMKSSCFKDENPVTMNAKNLISKQPDDLNNSLSNDFSQSNNTSTNSQVAISNGTFQCDKCSMSFNRLDLFQEHKIAHLMNPNLIANLQQANLQSQFESLLAAQQPSASPALSGKSPSATPLPNLFGNNQMDLNQSGSSTSPSPQQQQQQAFLLLQQLQLQQQANQMNKRKFSNDDDDDDSQSGGDGSQCSGNGRSAQNARDKRLRTTILPEQLDFLMQKYTLESNPSRKMLESISEEVGLKKRVVQVWFQNAVSYF